MLDLVLKYLSLITVAGAAISFVVGLVKYLDQRNREVHTRRFRIYHSLMRSISAVGDKTDEGLPLTQQLAAVYELQHFKDYAYASVPILKHLRLHYSENPEAPQALIAALESSLVALEETPNHSSKRTRVPRAA